MILSYFDIRDHKTRTLLIEEEEKQPYIKLVINSVDKSPASLYGYAFSLYEIKTR